MNKKYDFDNQYNAIVVEMEKLFSNGLDLPNLTDGYYEAEEDFKNALPIPFEDAFRILAETNKNYFRLKTRELNIYDSNFEVKDLAKLFSKYRTKSIIGCFPYTSAKYPWPTNSAGDVIPPMLQLDLGLLRSININNYSDGLLQVFASSVGESIRIIPSSDIEVNEIDKNYLLDQSMYQEVLKRFVTTNRVIQDICPAGTIVNQMMASTLKNCLIDFTSTLDNRVAAKYKKLISLFENIVHDDDRRGSYMFGWGWNYIDQHSIVDCFMQLEGPEFDFTHGVMKGCGCLRHTAESGFKINWNSYY